MQWRWEEFRARKGNRQTLSRAKGYEGTRARVFVGGLPGIVRKFEINFDLPGLPGRSIRKLIVIPKKEGKNPKNEQDHINSNKFNTHQWKLKRFLGTY